ncbi:hypothetical protein CR513_59846, partial [Mucuna pruriens]
MERPRSQIDLNLTLKISMINCDGVTKAKFVKDLHAKVKSHIEKKLEQFAKRANKIKKKMQLRKEKFPNLRKSKLFPHGDGPFKIIKKISDNAYIIELTMRTNFFKEGEPNKDFGSLQEDTKEVEDRQAYIGPMTRGKLRRLQ